MQCLIINLERSSERLAHIRGMFERLDVSFDRFEAVDGAQLAAESIARINASNRWVRPLVRAEMGCLLSHRACWNLIARGTAPFGAIFEDDVRLSIGAKPLLRSSDWIPQNADLIKLETRNRAVVVSRRSLRISPRHRLVRLFSFHDGLAGYIVSKRCAQWLYEQTEHCAAPVDQLVLNPELGIFSRLNVLQLTPSICIPEQLASRAEAGATGLSSTIDTDGRLYQSDETLLKPSSAARRGLNSRRAMQRIAASLRRVLQGQTRMRIEYR